MVDRSKLQTKHWIKKLINRLFDWKFCSVFHDQRTWCLCLARFYGWLRRIDPSGNRGSYLLFVPRRMDDIQLCKEITRLKKELQKLVSIPGEAPLLVSWGTTNAVTDCRIYVRSLDKDECAWRPWTRTSVLEKVFFSLWMSPLRECDVSVALAALGIGSSCCCCCCWSACRPTPYARRRSGATVLIG